MPGGVRGVGETKSKEAAAKEVKEEADAATRQISSVHSCQRLGGWEWQSATSGGHPLAHRAALPLDTLDFWPACPLVVSPLCFVLLSSSFSLSSSLSLSLSCVLTPTLLVYALLLQRQL
jgi:8-oxo-dGTP pyrophosphatase MutT (NUDIX family)